MQIGISVMSEENRLKYKLEKLAAGPGETGPIGRALISADGAGFIGAVLHEIDETILARLLTFTNDRQLIVKLDVSNRRLIRLSEVPKNGELDLGSDLLDRPFIDNNRADATALGELFGVFLADTTTLEVTSGKLDRDVAATEIGYSAEYLADVWGVGLYGREVVAAPDQLDPYIGYCQEIALAWFRQVSDGTIETSEPSGNVTRLVALSETILPFTDKALDGVINNADTPRCLVLATDSEGVAILMLQVETSILLCMVPANQLPGIVSGWHNIA